MPAMPWSGWHEAAEGEGMSDRMEVPPPGTTADRRAGRVFARPGTLHFAGRRPVGRRGRAKIPPCHRPLPLSRSLSFRTGAAGCGSQPANLTIVCSADFPPQPVDLAALPFSAQGEAELRRGTVAGGAPATGAGGVLLASTDNPRDRWLHEEMRKLFATVTRRESPRAGLCCPSRPAAEAGQELPLRVRLSRPRPFDSCRQPAGGLLPSRSRPGHGNSWRPWKLPGRLPVGHRLRQRYAIVGGCLPGRGRARCGRRFARPGRGVRRLGAAETAGERRGQARRTGRTANQRASMSLWQIRRTMPAFASPGSSWKPAGRPCDRAAGSSSSPSGPSGTPSTCRSGSTRWRWSGRRTIGSLAGGGEVSADGRPADIAAQACPTLRRTPDINPGNRTLRHRFVIDLRPDARS